MRAILHSLKLAERCLRALSGDLMVPTRQRLRALRCADNAAAQIREAGGEPMSQGNN